MRAFALGFLLATPGLLLLAACGGDDETPSELGGGAVDDGPAVVAAGCPATSITGATPEGTAFEASSAVAASIQDGAAYTLYLGDFDLTLVSVSVIGNPEVPAGGIMWTVAVTIFQPGTGGRSPNRGRSRGGSRSSVRRTHLHRCRSGG